MRNKILHIYLLLTLVFSMLFKPFNAQGDYMDLLLMFVDEKYDMCFKKALKYTIKEKTKKDPIPYLYVSKASYEMSRDHKYTNNYPKAYKTAISFAAKYRKKDKTYEFRNDAEDFIDQFKMVIIEEVENHLLEGTEATYSKASSLIKKTCDMDPDDCGSKLLYALLCTLTKNKSTAKEYYKICKPILENYGENKFSLKHMTESQQHYLRFALLEYANYYKKKDPHKAKHMLDYGKHLYYDENEFSKIGFDNEYKLVYDNL